MWIGIDSASSLRALRAMRRKVDIVSLWRAGAQLNRSNGPATLSVNGWSIHPALSGRAVIYHGVHSGRRQLAATARRGRVQ